MSKAQQPTVDDKAPLKGALMVNTALLGVLLLLSSLELFSWDSFTIVSVLTVVLLWGLKRRGDKQNSTAAPHK